MEVRGCRQILEDDFRSLSPPRGYLLRQANQETDSQSGLRSEEELEGL